MKKAFTLIELLVVVLIIGILASIALPQYTRAVEKARLSEALVNIKSIMDAYDLYELENPGGTDAFAEYAHINLTGGQWEEDGREFNTNYFSYHMLDEQSIEVYRKPFEYSLLITKHPAGAAVFEGGKGVEGKWNRGCYTDGTKLGETMCKLLEGQGFFSFDGEL